MRTNKIKKMIMAVLYFYQKYISPLKRKSTCIYIPTCSTYAIQAIEKYGVVKGCYLSLKRLIRCNPFAKGGYDPVP